MMIRTTQTKPTMLARIARFLQALLAAQLNRLHEQAAAVWADDAPARAWTPRPERLYRGAGAAFGRPH